MTLSVRELIERAAQLLGSETKLAKAREVSQNAISQAKSRGRAHQFLADKRPGVRVNRPGEAEMRQSTCRLKCADADEARR
jgi:hypothetical protein